MQTKVLNIFYFHITKGCRKGRKPIRKDLLYFVCDELCCCMPAGCKSCTRCGYEMPDEVMGSSTF